MKVFINIINTSALSAMLLLSGCGKQELPESEKTITADKNKQEIECRYFVAEGDQIIPYVDYWNAMNASQSRPSSRASDSGLPNGFTLYGVYNTVDVPDGKGGITSSEAAPADKRFFNGVAVNGNGTYTGDRRYWVADGKTRHSFAAIAGVSVTGNALDKGFTTDCFVPVVNHLVPSNPKDQTDLLVAYGPTNVVVNGVSPVVNIYFRHALSKLLFKLTTSGGVALYDCVLSITYKSNTVLQNVNYYYTTAYHSQGSTYLSGTYGLSAGVTVPTTATSEATAIEVGDMKVNSLSQAEGWLELSLTYAKVSGGAKVTPLKTKLPAQDLLAGMQYTYFVYVSEISETLSITDIAVDSWTTEIRMADPLD